MASGAKLFHGGHGFDLSRDFSACRCGGGFGCISLRFFFAYFTNRCQECLIVRRRRRASLLNNRFEIRHTTAEIILAFKDAVDDGGGDRQLSITGEVENGFYFMGDVAHSILVQESGHSLDGVKATEDRVYR